jgi:type IV pilus assembly protein PilA
MKKRNSGFTMLELVMVIIIIGVLAALAVPQYVSFVEKARVAEATNYIGAIKSAEVAYSAQNPTNGYFTSSMTDLGLNTSTPLWNFGVAGATNASVTMTATRNGGGTAYDGKTVILKYNSDGTSNWSGTHSGAPKT